MSNRLSAPRAASSVYRTKAQIVLDTIRERIIAGVLRPGERLTLRPIAEEFSCSEIPVREAIRALESEGYVKLVPHGGARVAELDVGQLVELTEVRSLLEPRATRLAAEAIPAEALTAPVDLARQMREVATGSRDGDYGALNREFHRAILSWCPNLRLTATINELWDQADRGRAVHRFFPGHVRISLEHHDQLLDAIGQRDFERVEIIAKIHSEHGLSAVKRLAESARADSLEEASQA